MNDKTIQKIKKDFRNEDVDLKPSDIVRKVRSRPEDYYLRYDPRSADVD